MSRTPYTSALVSGNLVRCVMANSLHNNVKSDANPVTLYAALELHLVSIVIAFLNRVRSFPQPYDNDHPRMGIATAILFTLQISG